VSPVLAGLAPVFILIAIGWITRASRLIDPDAFGAVNRFGYFVLYPAALFTLVSHAEFTSASALFVAALVLAYGLLAVLALTLRLGFRGDGPAFTSVFQGSVRWNGFAILAAAPGVYGHAGAQLIGLAFGPLVLLVNIICVAVLARWGARRTPSARALLDQIIANPLILSCAAGLAANAAGLRDLGPISGALNLLGAAAMPVALICIGAGLDFRALRASGAHVAAACAMRLVCAPAIVWSLVYYVTRDPFAAWVGAGMAATPTAAAGYTLAVEMGGDARLMAAIITAATLASTVTMPIVIELAAP